MKLIEKESELKEILFNRCQVKYGTDDSLFSSVRFVVSFRDNKSNSLLTVGVYNTPVEALRDLSAIIQAKKINADDIDVVIDVVFDYKSCMAVYIGDLILSPYLYYKKQDDKQETSTK